MCTCMCMCVCMCMCMCMCMCSLLSSSSARAMFAVAFSVALSPGLTARPVRHFINLSNGAEALALLERTGVPPAQVAFMRLQSSHCEAQDYAGVLANLDHNLLMHLALGYECRVYDFGSRGYDWEAEQGELERRYVPRAVWWGLEWTRYALTRMWKLPHEEAPLLRGYNVEANFEAKLLTLTKPLKKRIKYYRNHLAPDLDAVRLHGYYAATDLDGNKAAYREMLLAHATRSAASEAEATDPEAFATPLLRYDAQSAMRYERNNERSKARDKDLL